MKLKIYKNIIIAGLLCVSAFLSFACQKQTAQQDTASPTGSTDKSETTDKAQTPTEAYQRLYDAVKAKDKSKIKQLMSQNSLGLAELSAAQQKKQVDDILENGFTGTTFAPVIPQIRDERIKDKFGALEVYNSRDNRWEDLPFVYEDGGWKLAVGDVMQNTYKSPGAGEAELERQASGNNMFAAPNSNTATDNKMPAAGKP